MRCTFVSTYAANNSSLVQSHELTYEVQPSSNPRPLRIGGEVAAVAREQWPGHEKASQCLWTCVIFVVTAGRAGDVALS